MLTSFKQHYSNMKQEIAKKLSEFKTNQNASNNKFLEEMAFCVFAANSSAKMGLKASKLLRDVLENGTIDDYKQAVFKTVRFYNKRAEYMHHNKEKVIILGKNIIQFLSKMQYEERRQFIKEFKGFGMKESSHLLRNLGYEGYCIIDKHVLNVLTDMKVLDCNIAPKNDADYILIEHKIKKFAQEHNFNIDELDLAIWSYKTGEIIK
jgi:N-glycosylase/DNA lyase